MYVKKMVVTMFSQRMLACDALMRLRMVIHP